MSHEADEVYQALTRPPMLLGVTETYLVLMMVVEVLIFVGVGGGKGLLAAAASAPPIYMFGRIMCLRDPRIFEIWLIRIRWFAVARRRRAVWGGTSFDPS